MVIYLVEQVQVTHVKIVTLENTSLIMVEVQYLHVKVVNLENIKIMLVKHHVRIVLQVKVVLKKLLLLKQSVKLVWLENINLKLVKHRVRIVVMVSMALVYNRHQKLQLVLIVLLVLMGIKSGQQHVIYAGKGSMPHIMGHDTAMPVVLVDMEQKLDLRVVRTVNHVVQERIHNTQFHLVVQIAQKVDMV
jgi:hypothetical protein